VESCVCRAGQLIDPLSYILLDKPRYIEKRRSQESVDLDFNTVRAYQR